MANMNVNDFNAQRKGSYGSAASYHLASAYGHTASPAQTLRTAQYLSAGNHIMQHGHGDAGVGSLTPGFGAMNLNSSSYGHGGGRNSQVLASSSDYGGMALSQNQAVYLPTGQQVVYTGGHVLGNGTNQVAANGMYPQVSAHYMQQTSYGPGYMQQLTENSPQGHNWNTPRMVSDGANMPTLITPRRGSMSSNEDHVPGTPYTSYGGYHNAVAIMDRSPSGIFTNNTTPSPSQFVQAYNGAKNQGAGTVPLALQLLVQQDPGIPRAIPAPSSPMKPLDRCLENKNGETNVYIRGLLPETTDEILHGWGVRFGDIQSSKSIIDHKTDLCKGFGFIKYHNFEDAENCIRGFHYLGYEVSFARESFYSKLKKFSDEANTNLYVSNIPRNFNEHELSNCFLPYKVCSARILRDDRGNGRGVGFARFESRDVCEEVMKKFNNTAVSKPGGEEHLIQIRYSDTHEQKMLKQQTAAARQFRAAEFEYGCLQVGRNGLLHPERVRSISPATAEAANEFENFLQEANSGSGYLHPTGMGGRVASSYRPSLPTIKSEPSTGVQASIPTNGVKNEEGVALPNDSEGKTGASTPPASSKSSPTKTTTEENE